MARMVEIKCPICRYAWQVDYVKLQPMRTVYRGEQKTKIEEYHFKCQNCGTEFVQTFEVPDTGAKET